ncbi:hypothetical protein GTA08_BOTSDO12869 [Neofusicoccum parvum]|uniref:Uncharacterized protein n=1 Tax=Neofusicoccum parvum TaxID=310453 RepID=A0ACB5SME2_9PEZI|nr:hypothetical protein GTA08_BOTSDO12869 [Neofusicoccum parvum]
MSTAEGVHWTPQGGIKTGLPCVGAIAPAQSFQQSETGIFDVIVLGAGYAGLIAARDLSTQGRAVLLLEARDRIGGRTWNGILDGFNYEMGGTWIHWHMPHIYREVSLYGLQDDFIVTQVPGGKEDYCTLITGDERRNISHEEEEEMFSKVWALFCNVDGTALQETIPYPFDSMRKFNAMAKWDKLSCKDRMQQIEDQLTPEERGLLEAIVLQMGGGPLEDLGFLDAMRWWALGGWKPTGLNDIGLRTRLGSGQSTLARRLFDHARSTGRMSYSFSTPIASVVDNGRTTEVTSRNGKTWRGRSVVCTIPLNVLPGIAFSPPLPPLKTEAIQLGQANRGNKIHADISGPDLVSYTSFASPGKGMICAISDNLTSRNDTHVVLFGPTPDMPNGIPLGKDIDAVKSAVAHLLPGGQEIKRLVFHDWYADEFSKGTWCFFKPDYAAKYLAELQKAHGSVVFASADWSDGWRGWIDGAVQQGTQAARAVINALESSPSPHL